MTSTDTATDTTTGATDTAAVVRAIVAAELGVEAGAVGDDRDLRAVEGADSVKVLRIIARIEQRYDIELDDADVFEVTTVGEIAAVVDRERGAA